MKLYSAVESAAGVHFRLLHEEDHEPVQQQMVDPSTGRVVPNEEVRRAFQTEDGDLVMLDDEELGSLEPTSSRDIEITRFLDDGSIGHIWYDRPYYLGPDDDDDAYFALAEALRRQKREGVARWVMRKKPYAGALRLEGEHLMLMTLRHAGEVVAASELEAPGGRALDRRELGMAKQLVSALEDEFDPSEFRDEYRNRVLELVEAKAEGKVVKFPEVERKPAERSLADALERSLEAAKAARRKSG